MSSREFRVVSSGTELRADPGGTSISGYASVFDSESEDLGGFREVVKPGAFTRAIREKDDVRCLFNHDASRILGRVSAGTLALSQDAKGLHFRCDLPGTTYARDLMESVRRGDITQCSFGFSVGPDGQTWNRDRSKRELHDVSLFDVSPCTYASYSSTSIAARSVQIFGEDQVLGYYSGRARSAGYQRVNDDEWRTRALLRLARARLR